MKSTYDATHNLAYLIEVLIWRIVLVKVWVTVGISTSGSHNTVNEQSTLHEHLRTNNIFTVDLGPVVQSIVSLTISYRRQFVKYMLTILSNPLLFFVEKM